MNTMELNIDYHIKRLILIALNRYKTRREQGKALGITKPTLRSYCKKYGINIEEEQPKTQ